MNNGENNTNQTNVSSQPSLQPMEGVKIAPPSSEPVNASNKQTAVSAPNTTQIQQNTQQPQIIQTQMIQPSEVQQVTTQQTQTVQPQLQQDTKQEETKNEIADNPPKKKNKINLTPFLLIIIFLLGFYIVYLSRNQKAAIANLTYNCTPITASKETLKLDKNSTLVQDLYSKVYTNIREDIAEPEFNDSMRLYLAYRQVIENDKYDSNCNLFSPTSMEPYTCEVSTNFVPKAFKEEILVREIKKLYGEKTEIPLKNIQLGKSCIGGYQYIPERGEFVQGYCNKQVATSYKVTKTLVEATSTKNTIVLKEEVKYHENEKLSLPDYLKSGYYYYTFRLDMNYNYVLISKTYESKY